MFNDVSKILYCRLPKMLIAFLQPTVRFFFYTKRMAVFRVNPVLVLSRSIYIIPSGIYIYIFTHRFFVMSGIRIDCSVFGLYNITNFI